MIDYLSGKQVDRPKRIDAPPRRAAGQALVTAGFEAGTITLAGPDGDVTLVWRKADRDRRRALAPGAYALRTVRLARRKGRATWFVSATGPVGDETAYGAGTTTALSFDPTVRFVAIARAKRGGRLQLGFQVRSADDRGLSVYRKGKRVPVTYRVLDAKGRALASGTMNYG